MAWNPVNNRCVKTRATLTSSTAVLAFVLAAPVAAQAQQAVEGVEQVTVSSSRIMSADFDSPTPTVAISAADLEKQANPNVFTTITQLPSLMGSTGTSVGNGGSSNGVNGLSTLNLRGIGTNRNLVMIDGERVIPSSTIGVSDISQFPQMLIQRVDVVTGGASASWGSDAVTGVVNFIIDKKYEGFKANINGAITTYADDPVAQIQFAAGTGFLHDRAHFEISGEFTSDAGVDSMVGVRKWWQNPQQLQMFSTSQCQPNGCPGGAPQWFNVQNGAFTQFSYGGMVTRGPLQGTAFGQGGSSYQFNYGYGYGLTGPNTYGVIPATPQHNIGNANVTGCSSGGYCFGGDTQGNQTGYGAMVSRLVRGNVFARLGYDLTPDIELYATAMASEVVTWDKPTQYFFKSDNLQIGCDNPYLPSAVAAACTANAGGIAGTAGAGAYAPSQTDINNGAGGAAPVNGFVNGFTNGKMQYGALNSQLKSVENYNNRELRRFVAGADGTFNTLGTDWSFKTYFQHGEADYHNVLENILITPYYDAAIDAVTVTPANQGSFAGVPVGTTICRSAAARSVGCQPLNIIGLGGVSSAAQSFVQGTNRDGTGSGSNGRDPWQRVYQRQEVFDFVVSGEPIEDWAGKISVATGFQYREEAFQTVTDCASRGNCANETWAGVAWGPNGNPLLNPSAGPGLPPFSPNWYAGNFQPAKGNFHEMEAFVETNIPLLNDNTFGKVDLSLAGRGTHYTTSGDVSTWKVGLVWDTPVDGLRLRALQSRDVRAPNLAELYAGARVNNGSVTDDFACCAPTPALQQAEKTSISPLPNPITANPNLKPEKGATTQVGVVWSPEFIPGLNLSATYYRITVKGEITQLSQQQEMDLCYNGNALQCSFILGTDPATGQAVPFASGGTINTAATHFKPTLQTTPNINIAAVKTDGIDYEASYRFGVDDVVDWGLGGDVTLRLLATNVSSFITNPGFIGGVISESAGSNGGNTPHWKIFDTQAYDADNWGLFLNERWFSEGVINRNWVACNIGSCPAPVDTNHPTVNSNFMPSELYFDLGGHFDISPQTSLWFKVDNLTNVSPTNAYSYGPANQGPNNNPGLYDVLGRFYHIGVRIKT